MELSPGSILLGKYRIDELIGTGGMGNVVRASHLYLHQPVAIKLLLPEMADNPSTVQRFLREAQATVKLRSEHSARVMDVGTTPDGVPFMVMEFLDGNDLNQVLRHHGPQQPPIVVDLLLQACEGIAEAHALGIVHRDIKPSNFFITRRPDGSMLLKILDFGISKTPVGYDELTATQTVIGTPTYMAPEQMKSGRSADPRSDIWSIGVVMYQLIAGHPPFSGESYADLVLKVGLEPPAPMPVPLPAGLGDAIMRCLEKEPQARYQTVGELARVLAPYATDPISGAQSAERAMRILQQRGALQGVQGSPLTAGGGLAGPLPLSPLQLTPCSWPPSQATSLSRGAGQVAPQARGGRAWLIASVAVLCVLAGGGGYALSQLSQMSKAGRDPGGPHVRAPLPSPASEPAHPPPAAPTGSPAPPPTAEPAPPAPVTTSPAAAAAPPPAPAAPTSPATAAAPAPASDAPPTWRPIAASPTFADAHTGGTLTDTRSADGKPAGAKPAGAKPADAELDGKPANSRLVDAKQPVEHKTTDKPVEHKTTDKPVEHKTTDKPVEHKTTDKPAAKSTKPAKPKPSDDLFDSRK